MRRSQMISYRETMNILQQMFTGFDEETIKSVLTMNGGKLEQTIETLLTLCDENQNVQVNEQVEQDHQFDNYRESIFSDRKQQQEQELHGELVDPKMIQEKEDLKIAKQMQQQFDREAHKQSEFAQQQQLILQQMQFAQYQQSRHDQSKNDKKLNEKKQKQKKEKEKMEKQKKEKKRKEKMDKNIKNAQSVVNYGEHQFAGDDNDFKINKNLKQKFLSLFKRKKKQKQQQQQQSNGNDFNQNQQLAEDEDVGIELLDLNEQQLNFSDEELEQEKPQQYQWHINEETKLQEPRKEENNEDLERFDEEDEEEQYAFKHKIYATEYNQSNKQQQSLNHQGETTAVDFNLKL